MSVTTIRRPLFLPHAFLLHSHSMTSVKELHLFNKIPILQEQGAEWAGKPVILNVSRFSRECHLQHKRKNPSMGNTHDVAAPCHTPRQTNTVGRQVRAYYCDQCLPAVWILPWQSSFRQNALERDLRKSNFASKQHLSVTKTVVWFTFSIMQLSKGLTTSFLDRNLRFHCHMYCFGALQLGSDQIPLYWLPAFVHSFPSQRAYLGITELILMLNLKTGRETWSGSLVSGGTLSCGSISSG